MKAKLYCNVVNFNRILTDTSGMTEEEIEAIPNIPIEIEVDGELFKEREGDEWRSPDQTGITDGHPGGP